MPFLAEAKKLPVFEKQKQLVTNFKYDLSRDIHQNDSKPSEVLSLFA